MTLSKQKKIFIFLGLIFLFFFTRTLSLHNGVDSQDGNGLFGQLFFKGGESPKFMELYRINGVDYFFGTPHPDAVYLLPKYYGKLAQNFFGTSNGEGRAPADTIITLKMYFWIFLFSVYFVLLFNLFEPHTKKTFKILLVYLGLFLILPISRQASREFEVDSSFGLLAMLPLGFLSLTRFKERWILSIAGILIGLGKNEWTFATVFSCVFYAILSVYFKKPKEIKIVIPYLIGLIMGNIMSYAIGPEGYIGGWRFMSGLAQSRSVLKPSEFRSWLFTVYSKAPYAPAIMSAIFVGLYSESKFKTDMRIRFLLSISLGLFLPFFMSTTGAASRYYVPSWIVSYFLIFAVLNRKKEAALKPLQYLAFFFCFVVVFQNHLEIRPILGLLKDPDPKCLWSIDVMDSLQNSKINFIDHSLGYENIQKMARDHGLKVCDHVQ